jgi:uncharacterized protein YcbK (DUF882 family)
MHEETRTNRGLFSRRSLLSAIAGLMVTGLIPQAALASPMIAIERRLRLYNPHGDEAFDDAYWANGLYFDDALQRISWIMRDNLTGEVHPVDPLLLDLLCCVTMPFETRQPLELLSGYRSHSTNELLRTEGAGAAANSMHLVCKAADIRLAGVRLPALRHAALALRGGGVGYYPASAFVHIDTGPVRSWAWGAGAPRAAPRARGHVVKRG